MLDMNSCHIFVRLDKNFPQVTIEKVNLTKIPPLDRAKFMMFVEDYGKYIFSKSEIVSLTAGYVPEFVLNYL